MFRDFSFNPASPPAYRDYEADRAAMNVSPTSQPPSGSYHHLSRPPTPPCTIGDLASKLNQQSLRIDSTLASLQSSQPPTPPSYEEPIEPLDPASPRPTYSRVSASLLRMQRQSSSRMHCSSSHVRDISRLVRMIEEEEQCNLNQDASRSSSTSTASSSASSSGALDGDEGVDMEYDISSHNIEALVGMQQWRASDKRDCCIRVTKPVRMRKRSGNKIEKRRST